MPTPPRFGYLTTNMTALRKARTSAALSGYVVDLYPLDAPAPKPGQFDGLIAEFAPNAPHKLARKMFLAHLVKLAKAIPVAVHDMTLTPEEANALRVAGIERFVSFKDTIFKALLARPVAVPVPEPAEEDVIELTDEHNAPDDPRDVPTDGPKSDDAGGDEIEPTAE